MFVSRVPRILSSSLLALSITAVVACGDKSSDVDDETGLADPKSSFKGLAFTTVDRNYTASQLWFNDFETGEQRSLSTGEGNDPWLTDLNGTLYLFNRGTSLNYRAMSPTEGPVSEQMATPGAASADPHAALYLGEGRTLLAMNVAGKLVVVNPETGAAVQEVAGTFDTGTGPFHPEAFYHHAATNRVFVLHQGFVVANNTVTLNGSSQVFVFEDKDGTLTAVDQDTTKTKIQGIPLNNANPVAFVTSAAKPLIVGSCSSMSQGTCRAVAEALDPEALTVTEVFDFTSLGFTGNGPVVDAGNGRFYANLVKTETSSYVVAKIDPTANSIDTVHTFPAGSYGCCATYFDQSSETLYVGDAPAEGDEGLFSIYRSGATTPTEVKVKGLPYSGVFLSK